LAYQQRIRPVGDSRTSRFLAVLFDFGGTLDADGEPAVDQFFRAYRAVGGRRDAEEFTMIFRESDRQLASDPAIGTLGFRETVKAQSRLLARLMGDVSSVDAAHMAKLVGEDAVAAAQRSARTLEALHARGIRTGIVSNFTGNLGQCLADLGLASAVDVVIDSAVVGVRKPERAIFLLALERVGVEPNRALMVGDNPFADIQAAAALGMSTCWLAPLSRAVPDGCAPTFRIARLSDLLVHLQAAPTSAKDLRCTG
jgi:HAD superfamily hydrolase (TIGR01509 family)